MINECPECGSERTEQCAIWRCPDCGAEFMGTWFNWIRVNRKLPDKSKFVLVCENGDAVSSPAWFNKIGLPNSVTGKVEHFWWNRKAVPADFWMDMPKPPAANWR